MLTIAQCTDSFLPLTDGVGRVCFEYARSLGALGYPCYVITPMANTGYRGQYPFEIVDFMGGIKLNTQSYRASAAMLDLHYLFRSDALRLDIVHAHSPGAAGMEGARLAARLHVPLVGTFHPKYFEQFFSEGAGSTTARHALDYYNRCDEVWVSSWEARDRLKQFGVTCNIEVFENGTYIEAADVRAVKRLKATLHLTDAPILLCVGSLERAKNLPVLLQAAALLAVRGTAFQLLFVGTGPEEANLKAMASALGLMGHVRVLGTLTDCNQLDALYAASALCLFPWQSVSPGLVVCEAAAQGTPSLVTKNTASAQAVTDGVNGLVCDGTAEDMAEAIFRYLADGARAREMGQNALQTVPVLWEEVIERVVKRYETLAGLDKASLRRKRGFFRKELQQVDQTLEKRTLDLMGRFLRQDMQHIYVYPYQRMKPAFLPTPDMRPLPRATPESQGVGARAINELIAAIACDPMADAHAIMVLRHGKVIAEASWEPYELALPHQLYSLSKSVTATAIGMLVDEGRLSIDEYLCDLFPERAPDDLEHPVYALTVRNLLNMSTGSLFNEIGTALGSDWEGEFMRAGVRFPAGSAFAYNSMNTYMLAAIVRRKTGQTLTEYLTPRLFEPLGIDWHEWETSPSGTEKGGWGLSLTLESVAKLGQLYLNGGVWTVDGEARQLLSAEWIEAATQPQIDTPDGEITFGYGHQIWMTSRPGAFLFNGAFGQYMLAIPDCDAVVALFSGTSRLFAQGGVMDEIDVAFSNLSDEPLPEDPAALQTLQTTCAQLSAHLRAPFYDPTRETMPFEELCGRLDGLVYTFDANVGSLLPVILSSVENNYGPGIARAAFRREEDGLRVELSEGTRVHRIHLAKSGYAQSVVRQREDSYIVRANYQSERIGGSEWGLHLNVHFIETPYTRVLHFLFRGDAVTLNCDEYPSVKDASEMLLELSGLTRQQVVRAMLPLLKHDQLQNRLKTFTTLSVQGKL